MKTWFAISLLVLGGAIARAQPAPLNNALRSVSGQFVIYDLRPPAAPSRAPLGTNELELEPTVLVVSCERIKQALGRELDAGRDWSRTINVFVRPAPQTGGPASISVPRALR